DRRERLVDLDPLDVVDRLAGPRERLLARLRGRAREVREVVGHIALGQDGRKRFEAAALGELLRTDDNAAGAVVDARHLAPGRGPLWIEHGLQLRQRLDRGVAARPLVGGEVAYGHDLALEEAVVLRLDGALVRAKRPQVLLLARDPELARDERRLLDHVPPVE